MNDLSDTEILAIADDLFPRWREDIQEKFVLMLGRGVFNAHLQKLQVSAQPGDHAIEQANKFAQAEMMPYRLAREKTFRENIKNVVLVDPMSMQLTQVKESEE